MQSWLLLTWPSAKHQPTLRDHGYGASASHCRFTSQLSLVLILPNHGQMAHIKVVYIPTDVHHQSTNWVQHSAQSNFTDRDQCIITTKTNCHATASMLPSSSGDCFCSAGTFNINFGQRLRNCSRPRSNTTITLFSSVKHSGIAICGAQISKSNIHRFPLTWSIQHRHQYSIQLTETLLA